ncbi:MAG: carbohydrate binding domain-containing protein [Verrucomicrobiota bacterium]
MAFRIRHSLGRGEPGGRVKGGARGHVWVARWVSCLLVLLSAKAIAAAYPDRFVWVFGWGLDQDSDVTNITRVLNTAARHGLNGAVVSFGLDTLCQHDADYFRRLKEVQERCVQDHLELIPTVFSVGYGGGLLAHNPNLAEGLPVTDAPFVVAGSEARFVPDDKARVVNGGFEEFLGDRFSAFAFCDDPGKISFADTEVKHGGRASLRLENFGSDPNGHGRVMQTIQVTPHRCYRASLWVKTEGLRPVSAFRCMVLANDHELAPRDFKLPATTEWRKISFLFNSLTNERVNLYAGLWEGKAGKVWLDDLTVEDAGPVNVLRRPGTPVAVRSDDGSATYAEGRDYAALRSPDFNVWRGDSTPAVLKLLPGSRIQDGQRLRVSWYHPMLIYDSQVTVCMAEPEVYDIIDHEAKLLAEHLHPHRVLLGMDEIRMGGTCRACAGRDLAALLGECVTRQAAAIHRYSPDAQIYVWSDMFDPNHNAHDDYYLVHGSFAGSWDHLPKDITVCVWGGEPQPESLKFFADRGFATLVACYYDEENLDDVRRWLSVAQPLPKVRGFMYTPWTGQYDLLPAFGDLFK